MTSPSPVIIPSPEIWHRDDFALLCAWRKLFSVIEVGVDRGEFAKVFLRRSWNCHRYIGVDNYEPYDEMPWCREADKMMAISRMESYGNIAKLIVGGSLETAESISKITPSHPDASAGYIPAKTDFIYIDGSHYYPDVLADIHAWFPLVSDYGILAGHDFDDGHPGVIKAVTEFASLNNHTVYFTTNDHPRSWYLYKEGKPGNDWVRNTGD